MTHSDPAVGKPHQQAEPLYPGAHDVVSGVIDVEGIPLSFRASRAPQPRAAILALHGGGTTSTYFDCPGSPRLSLLRTGSALGFTVIALDRPGYGASADYAEKVTNPARRVDLAFAVIERLLPPGPRGEGVFLLAHSAGCELAMRMAADERGQELLGLEIAGTGQRHHSGTWGVLDSGEADQQRQPIPRRGLRDLLWGPSHLYPPDVFGGAGISSATPAYEAEARHWNRAFPDLAARVLVPVQFSLGEHETVWQSGSSALSGIASLFTSSARVRVNEQADSGHNLSLGYAALAYHLKVLSFAEECAAARQTAMPEARPSAADGVAARRDGRAG